MLINKNKIANLINKQTNSGVATQSQAYIGISNCVDDWLVSCFCD